MQWKKQKPQLLEATYKESNELITMILELGVAQNHTRSQQAKHGSKTGDDRLKYTKMELQLTYCVPNAKSDVEEGQFKD